jgi:hypothetical protein
MDSPAIPLVITPIGLCKHRDRFCRHDARIRGLKWQIHDNLKRVCRLCLCLE